MKALTIMVALLSLASCATVPPPNTPSGKVELLVQSTDLGCIKSKIISKSSEYGYSLTRESDHQVVLSKPIDNTVVAVLFGSNYDPFPHARVTFTFVESGNATRLILDEAIVTNPGSGFERVNSKPQSQQNQDDFQSWAPYLNQCKNGGMP